MKIALVFATSGLVDLATCAAVLAAAGLWWRRVGERRFLQSVKAPGGSQSREQEAGE